LNDEQALKEATHFSMDWRLAAAIDRNDGPADAVSDRKINQARRSFIRR
jgi:hypothetical protein